MGPAQSIRTCLAKAFQFTGRASRSEFWWFAPLPILVCWGTLVLADVTHTFSREVVFLPLLFLVFPSLSFAMIAAGTRRLVDTGSKLAWIFPSVQLLILAVYVSSGAVLVALSSLAGWSNEKLQVPGFLTVFILPSVWALVLLAFAVPLTRPSHSRLNSNEVPS